MLHSSNTTAEHQREEVVVMLGIILSAVWDVLSKVLGSYLYDKFFKDKKYQALFTLFRPLTESHRLWQTRTPRNGVAFRLQGVSFVIALLDIIVWYYFIVS